jgi:hypothetical protein
MDRKQVKSIADTEARKEVGKHEKKMHGMKKGGPTSMDMRRVGRNVARVNNQRGR